MTPDLEDPTFPAALDAAAALLPDVDRDQLAAALRAAQDVYAAAADDQEQELLNQNGLVDMGGVGKDMRMRIVHALTVAAATVKGFDDLLNTQGVDNYIETDYTITDRSSRDKAIEDGAAFADIPPTRTYRLIVIRPGRPGPHQLRRHAEQRIAAALALLDSGPGVEPEQIRAALLHPANCVPDPVDGQVGRIDVLRYVTERPDEATYPVPRCTATDRVAAALALTRSGLPLLSPRTVAAALGYPMQCTSLAGDCDADYDPQCPQHGSDGARLTDEQLRALLPAARRGMQWTIGARFDVTRDDPGRTGNDGFLLNVLESVALAVSEMNQEATR